MKHQDIVRTLKVELFVANKKYNDPSIDTQITRSNAINTAYARAENACAALGHIYSSIITTESVIDEFSSTYRECLICCHRIYPKLGKRGWTE